MFLCPKCRKAMNLPSCSCGYTVKCKNEIWQLSNMPDIITDGDGEKYIGYEYIGEAYSGNRKYIVEERNLLFAQEISRATGNGIFLDLACGDGCFTVPCASLGTKIIAGDISNNMLSILQQKAKYNRISLKNVTLCRINALEIPLENESVDTVVANSVLHLISNPEKVVDQIFRVLKKGGKFICKDDRPGVNIISKYDNTKYNELIGKLCKYYDIVIQNGITPKKYSWNFDRDFICNKLFSNKTEKIIERDTYFEHTLRDGFLARLVGRGFSDQVDIPQDLHNKAIKIVLDEIKEEYGDDFANESFKGNEDNLLITTYTK